MASSASDEEAVEAVQCSGAVAGLVVPHVRIRRRAGALVPPQEQQESSSTTREQRNRPPSGRQHRVNRLNMNAHCALKIGANPHYSLTQLLLVRKPATIHPVPNTTASVAVDMYYGALAAAAEAVASSCLVGGRPRRPG